MTLKYRYRDWLFYYLLGIVPFNLLLWRLDFVWPKISLINSLVNCSIFVLEIILFSVLWYRVSELLASRNTHDKRREP